MKQIGSVEKNFSIGGEGAELATMVVKVPVLRQNWVQIRWLNGSEIGNPNNPNPRWVTSGTSLKDVAFGVSGAILTNSNTKQRHGWCSNPTQSW